MKMRKIMSAFLLALLAVAPLAAKNLKADIDRSHDLWWNAPERPVLGISLTDTTASGSTGKLRVFVSADTMPSQIIFDRTFDVETNGKERVELSVELPVNRPGFYRCHISDDGNIIDEINIGYEPTNIVSLPDAQPDFEEFWKRAKRELAEVPADYTLTPLPELSGKTRDMYLCTFRSWGGDTIKARVAIPKKPGKYPVTVFFNGYGGKPWDLDPDGNPEWIEMQTSVRGQFLSEDGNRYGDWIRYNLDKPESYYYKGAYLDAVRAIDVVEQLPQADRSRLYAEGGSQGGALTLAAAALTDGRLRAIAPYIPFMSDFRDYFRIVPWPASAVGEAREALGMTEEEMYRNLSYFDIKNFARMIKCPVLMGIGLQDPTCPPHTNMSGYNLISSPKELHIYPDCGHTVDYSDWNPRRTEFFNKY